MYVFKGKLTGRLCTQCWEVLSNVKIRLYRLREDQQVTALTAANPKDTAAVLTDDMIKAKAAFLIAETETNEKGEFVFKLGEKEKYQGGPFEVDVYCETVPNRKPTKRKYSPVQFTVTTVQPMWRDSEEGLVAGWEYELNNRVWCYIRARLGAWVICGKVTVCNTDTPIYGVRVRAFDTDWLQDDDLGSAITDINGKFRIDYLEEDFKKTPLSPCINWEMVSGPDLYFKVETPGGTLLLGESRSRGRDADRENAGPCFCVHLCLKEKPEQIDPDHTYPLFTHVGAYKITTDFTTDGLTSSGNHAFTETIPLIGILPGGGDPIPMEYRFLYAEYSSGVPGPLTVVDGSMIPKTKIGQLEYWTWNSALSVWEIAAEDYWVNNPAATYNVNVGSGGWIQVPTENDLGFPPTPGVGKFVPNGNLINLNTEKLVNEFFDLISPTVHLAGDSLPAAQKSDIHTFQLTFQAREVSTVPVTDTNSLNKIIISNTHYKYRRHPGWNGHDVNNARAVCMLDIKEMVDSGNGCGTLGDELHALFTAYHPHAAGVSVYFVGNSPLPPPYSPALVSGEAASTAAGHFFDISALLPCAYVLWLSISLNLTRGWGSISAGIWDYIAFCK